MNIYLIWQTVNDDYDTYDSAVVAAESEEKARYTHPDKAKKVREGGFRHVYDAWCGAGDVQVKRIGGATSTTKAGVILASFNAG